MGIFGFPGEGLKYFISMLVFMYATERVELCVEEVEVLHKLLLFGSQLLDSEPVLFPKCREQGAA